MGNSSQTMPKVEFDQDDTLKSTLMYKKFLESKNRERAALARKALLKKRFVFGASVALVFGIYTYTIVKIKQETFLDDFEEPPRIIKAEQ